MIYRNKFFSLFFLSFFLLSCSTKTESENLNEKDLKKTTNKAINLIKQKDYSGFRNLFAPKIAKDISNIQMNKLVDQLNSFLARKEFPDEENIVFESYKSLIGSDSVLINDIIYKFDNPSHSLHSYSRSINFSFIPKYGPDKLCGVHLTDDADKILK